jgi:hypothetical protein
MDAVMDRAECGRVVGDTDHERVSGAVQRLARAPQPALGTPRRLPHRCLPYNHHTERQIDTQTQKRTERERERGSQPFCPVSGSGDDKEGGGRVGWGSAAYELGAHCSDAGLQLFAPVSKGRAGGRHVLVAPALLRLV